VQQQRILLDPGCHGNAVVQASLLNVDGEFRFSQALLVLSQPIQVKLSQPMATQLSPMLEQYCAQLVKPLLCVMQGATVVMHLPALQQAPPGQSVALALHL
jgi:hypothetical protein